MKDVIELAKQAGLEFQAVTGITGKTKVTTCGSQPIEKIELLIKLVRNAALEEAANTCVDLNNDEATSAHRYDQGTTERRAWNQSTTDCADAIRNLKVADTMTTKDVRIAVVCTGGLFSGSTIAALVAKGISVELQGERVLAEASPEPLCLPIMRDPEPIGPWWEPHTGKKKAQWKQETYGRKLK